MAQGSVHRTGGCHCGRVRFRVAVPEGATAYRCNCSICAMCGFIHLIVPASAFELVSGEDALLDYTFASGVAKHRFCRSCGIKSFYIPRSNPDGFSVHLHCLDEPLDVPIDEFDGQNWENNAAALADLSRE